MATKQKVRIIGGDWRSRQLRFADIPGLRPTGDRIRETLFNWLAPHITGARCLDLFCGSGALCFEALSRGAAHCLAMEQNPKAIACLNESKKLLDAQGLTIAQTDTLGQLRTPPKTPFDIAFVDPPFDLNLVTEVCALLENNQWLATGGLIYCELPAQCKDFVPPANWQVLRSKVSGGVSYILFARIEPEAIFK